MKTLLAIVVACALGLLVMLGMFKYDKAHATDIEVFEPRSITLSPNPYVMEEELLKRVNDPAIRQVTFFWAFEDSAPDLPARWDCVVRMENVATLIDSVTAVHLEPRIHTESGKPERRLVGVTVGEPIMTNDPIYGVKELDWVPTMVWHRN